ncbi:MAG TPA: hypothetical protein VJ885_15755 [Thermoanaerobaculia bacterium]|nr:hypothetical protein [Thermoanaerobaculia bacterium]
MVEGVAREAIHVGDHEDVDLLTPLVLLPQVRQGGLQLGTIGCLGGLAALDEDTVDLPAVLLAEGPALFFLDGEGKVEGLLFAADSAVDDGPEIGHPDDSFSGTLAFLPPWAKKCVTVISARP